MLDIIIRLGQIREQIPTDSRTVLQFTTTSSIIKKDPPIRGYRKMGKEEAKK